MRKIFITLCTLCLINSCSEGPNGNVTSLKWMLNGSVSLEYEVFIKPIEVQALPKLNFDAISGDKDVLIAELKKLKQIDIGDSTHIADVVSSANVFQGRVSRSQKNQDGQEILQTELFGKFDSSGNLQSYYLPQKQKNLLNLFFDVPDGEIDLNTVWERDINIIQIGQNFVPRSDKRENINFLMGFSENAAGEALAEIGGLVYEYLDGEFEYADESQSFSVRYETAYFFYGEFNMSKGYWESNRTIAYLGNFKTGEFEDVSLYAIQRK